MLSYLLLQAASILARSAKTAPHHAGATTTADSWATDKTVKMPTLQCLLQVEGIENTTAITAGSLHSCALSEDGTISCWGDNTLRPGQATDKAETIGTIEVLILRCLWRSQASQTPKP